MTDDLRTQLERTLSGTYALERELGGGGMSRVFVAEETSLGRKVVVKVLPPSLAATVNVERFRREIQLAAQLQHPHIVPLLSAGIADGLPYYTMPLVEGESLRERLRRQGELPVGETLRILRDIASALSYAHEHGVVHRDIKPENVLVTRHHALVADFGVAKALSASTNPGGSLTSLGVALGTPAYMAPEQAAADPATDHRADIYAVGALAYELLTGRQVFGDRSPQAMLHAHAVEQPAPIEVHRPSVPRAVATLVMQMLEKHPADRPQTADDLLSAFEGFVATPSGGMTPTATPATQRTPAVVQRTRPSRALIAAAFVGAGILAAAGMMARSRMSGPAVDPLRVVVPAFVNRTGDTRFDELGVLAADWVTRGLTQADVADVALIDSVSGAPGLKGASLSDDELISLAANAGAGRVVRGSIMRRGDSLDFQVSVVDVRSRRVLASVQPATAAASDPMPGVDRIRQQTMGALATLSGRSRSLTAADAPPNFEAYQEFIRGENEFGRGRFGRALAHYLRAAELDATYAAPLVRAAYSHSNSGQCAQTDSLVGVLRTGSRRLSEYEGYYLDRVAAWCQGDWNAAYRAARSMLGLAPTSSFAINVAGRSATAINRLTEARVLLERLWPNKYDVASYYNDLGIVYHLTGDRKKEEKAVALARENFSDQPGVLVGEARLYGALGDSAQVDRVQQELRSRHRPPDFDATGPMLLTAVELATHGHEADSRAELEELYGWMRRRPARESSDPNFPYRLAQVAAAIGRCEEARAITNSKSLADTVILRIVSIGIVAARCGDTRRAEEALDRLSTMEVPYMRGLNALAGARITALLGRRREAVDLLEDAVAAGVAYAGHFHNILEFATLRDYPPFKALLAPKD